MSDGIVHHEHIAASGESWLAGPVILSWQDIVYAVDHSSHNECHHP